MRKRFQKGSLQKIRGEWVARWREDGQRRARKLGRTSLMTKTQAQAELAAIVGPINASRSQPSDRVSFGDFVQQVYLPFYRRKWKRSTAMTNEDRLKHHLTSEFDPRSLGSFDRDELQAFLDQKARTLSFGMVEHLRWDPRTWLERETGIEPATSSLGSWHSTAELLPLNLTTLFAES